MSSIDTQCRAKQFTPQSLVEYRAVSNLAVVSLLFGLLSWLAWFDWSLAIVPWSGLLTGTVAARRIRTRPDELTGSGLARVGLALSLVGWLSGWSALGVEYVTEVPAGYKRLSFADLQPPADAPTPISQAARDHDGQRVFLKGYVLPGRQTTGIEHFILVWNSGDCCFGGSPPLTHMVEVRLQAGLQLNYSPRQTKVAGTFQVDYGAASEGQMVVYRLAADYLQ